MSFVGRKVELLEPEKEELYPDFFKPKPVSPKHKGTGISRKSNTLFADNSGNIHIRRKPVIKIRPEMLFYEPVNILGKQKLADAFGEEIYNDQDRYGQDIPADFFNTNVGHGVTIDLIN